MSGIPEIKRAREYRLYGYDGVRYLDLFQDNGRAIIGHRPGKVILEIKSLLSRGLLSAYPSIYAAQAEKSLQALIPRAAEVRIYASPEKALYAAARHHSRDAVTAVDPAMAVAPSGRLVFWRPFIDMDAVDADILLPIVPVPAPPAATALVFLKTPSGAVPLSDVCSPVSLVALRRSVYDLIAYMRDVNRERWKNFDRYSFWSRKGPYLRWDGEDDYSTVFRDLLEHGILIAPDPALPSIIPGTYANGELRHLERRYVQQ